MKTLKELFPRSSNSFLKANEKALTEIAAVIRAADKAFTPDAPKLTRRGVMNKVEREFAMILEAQRRNGEIASYEFEGITLRWSGISYTPDFAIFPLALAVSGQIKLVEVKGPYIKGKFERAVERFRHARTYYGDRFLFELWQKTRSEGWHRLL